MGGADLDSAAHRIGRQGGSALLVGPISSLSAVPRDQFRHSAEECCAKQRCLWQTLVLGEQSEGAATTALPTSTKFSRLTPVEMDLYIKKR
jgi:hypothetical protein